MKRKLFPFLMLVLLLGINKTFAQQAKTVTGTFKAQVAKCPAVKLIDVNYTMTISPAKDNLTIETKSADEALFSFDVLGADNKVIVHWTPDAKTANSHSFDISALTSGSYHLIVNNTRSSSSKGESKISNSQSKLHDIPFTK